MSDEISPESLADELIGSCRSLTDIEQGELDQQEFADAFDLLAFECSCCGWWCSTDELNDGEVSTEQLCAQCAEDE